MVDLKNKKNKIKKLNILKITLIKNFKQLILIMKWGIIFKIH